MVTLIKKSYTLNSGLKHLSWLAPDKLKPKSDTRRKRKKAGRKQEEGGHKRINISIARDLDSKLDKIRKHGGNVSKFFEKEIKPALEQLDPNEASLEVWRIETHLNQQISESLIEDKPEKAKALTSILVALKDYRNLGGISPLDPQLLSTETVPLWKKQASERFKEITSRVVKEPLDTILEFGYLIVGLPEPQRGQLEPAREMASKKMLETALKTPYSKESMQLTALSINEYLISEISKVLYES